MRSLLTIFIALLAFGASGCFVFVEDDDPVVLADYEECDVAFPGECDSGLCYEVAVANSVSTFTGMCSEPCGIDADCFDHPTLPGPPACLTDVAGPNADICYLRCVVNSDCPLGFNCFVGEPSGVDICLPAA